ncbi:hypothetical protein ISI02_19905 [Burkholderia pseudomallei]|nr:hypothetical protein [Burkholderia pseudomallei]
MGVDVRRPTSDVRRPTPDARRPTSDVRRPTPNAQRPTPNAQRPTPNAQRPTPNAQRPTPNGRDNRLACAVQRLVGQPNRSKARALSPLPGRAARSRRPRRFPSVVVAHRP